MTADYINRLLDALPESGLPLDLQDWLRELFAYDERDELIRLIVKLSPGESVAAKLSYFLNSLDTGEHASIAAQGMLAELVQYDVPRSLRQLRRILRHSRSDGWKVAPLCHSVSPADNGENCRGEVNGKYRSTDCRRKKTA